MRRLAVLVCALAVLPGCGFGEGETSSRGVSLTVTRDFGSERLGRGFSEGRARGDTAMRQLQRSYRVDTRYGGGFVQEIDGVAGGREGGRQVDWFYYVNGIEMPVGSAERTLSGGERVWWDHHPWDEAQRIPAVVGSFPEPFVSGLEGKRFPVRLVCMTSEERSCDEVETRLEDAGVRGISRSVYQQSQGEQIVRVLVGTWADVRRDGPTRRLERGPGASGVFARPSESGSEIELLDSTGAAVRTLGAGGGLVAATSLEAQGPTWLVTGTDDVGVAAAAASLTEERLRERFAVAIDGGRDVPLPVPADPIESRP